MGEFLTARKQEQGARMLHSLLTALLCCRLAHTLAITSVVQCWFL